jgi:hypothetical protein
MGPDNYIIDLVDLFFKDYNGIVEYAGADLKTFLLSVGFV